MYKENSALPNLDSDNEFVPTDGNKKRQWLVCLPQQPWWLKNNIHSVKWVVIDKSQKEPQTIHWDYIFSDSKGNVFCLTDPENSHLLETIQLVCYKMRDSHFATCDSAELQKVTALRLFTIVAWMRLNDIFQFNQLTQLEFDKYARECIYGTANLLDSYNRLNMYVANMRQSGKPMPKQSYVKSRFNHYRLDLVSIGENIGLNFKHQSCIDSVMSYRLAFLAKEEGLWLKPRQRVVLEQDEPLVSVKSSGYVENLLIPWKRLWDLRTELDDSITFDPFCEGTTKSAAKQAIKEADEDSEETCTGTIPEYQAAFIIDRALRWVMNYSDDLLNLRDKYESVYQLFDSEKSHTTSQSYKSSCTNDSMQTIINSYKPTGFDPDNPLYHSMPWPIVPMLRLDFDDNRLTLNKAVNNFLPIACLIVICAFTANRFEAALNIYDNNTKVGDPNKSAIETDEEGDWLWCWVGKSIRAWDRVPCPRVVKKAVEVLHRLSETARDITGSRKLFQIKKFGNDEIIGLTNLNDILKEFSKFVGVPPLEDGTHWNFTLHQFRKFFAILYMSGYEHGNLSALSHHMRHFDFKVTEDYILKHSNDTTLSKMRKHRTADLLVDIADGKRQASGKAGEILSEMMDKLLKQALKNVKLISANSPPEAARRIAERVMQKLELTLVPFMWGYCAAFKKLDHEVFTGNCTEHGRQESGPDLAKATPKNCYGCNHFYTDQHFKIWWESMADIYEGHLQDPNLPNTFFSYTEEMAVIHKCQDIGYPSLTRKSARTSVTRIPSDGENTVERPLRTPCTQRYGRHRHR